MKNYSYMISLAKIPIQVNCHFPYTAFEDFRTNEIAQDIISADLNNVTILHQYNQNFETESSQNAEFMQLIGEAGNCLLKYNRCIFHGTAFIWHEKAWILTAPSGTGKTTQYVLWKFRYGNELSILNGDKPILEFCENETVLVHPSPWKGKENMGIMRSAPLGGIIYLKQGSENSVRRLAPDSAVIPIYLQFMFLWDKKENVSKVCELETILIKNYPVWELTNCGDVASAELMHDTLLHWEEK